MLATQRFENTERETQRAVRALAPQAGLHRPTVSYEQSPNSFYSTRPCRHPECTNPQPRFMANDVQYCTQCTERMLQQHNHNTGLRPAPLMSMPGGAVTANSGYEMILDTFKYAPPTSVLRSAREGKHNSSTQSISSFLRNCVNGSHYLEKELLNSSSSNTAIENCIASVPGLPLNIFINGIGADFCMDDSGDLNPQRTVHFMKHLMAAAAINLHMGQNTLMEFMSFFLLNPEAPVDIKHLALSFGKANILEQFTQHSAAEFTKFSASLSKRYFHTAPYQPGAKSKTSNTAAPGGKSAPGSVFTKIGTCNRYQNNTCWYMDKPKDCRYDHKCAICEGEHPSSKCEKPRPSQ
jgi:hypothetical protein